MNNEGMNRRRAGLVAASALLAFFVTAAPARAETELFWGDTHLHTAYSFDAFMRENISTDQETAYRFAKGLPVVHPYHKARIQIETPLDFLVVADHAELLGLIKKVYEGGPKVEDTPAVQGLRHMMDAGQGFELFMSLLPSGDEPRGETPASGLVSNAEELSGDAWLEYMAAADKHYEPGRFTTLVGWEWSSLPLGANLHRVVFTNVSGEKAAQFRPYSSLTSDRPEDLWAWLDKTANQLGIDFVAIPHNSNISKGLMFAETDSDRRPIDSAYAKTRLRWEPVVEVTQIKGDSETHPAFSTTDEFAQFEEYSFYIQRELEAYRPDEGDYVRSALRRGLALERQTGTNPYQFGLIGSTDSHTALATAEEDNFAGKMAVDSTPGTKLQFAVGRTVTGWHMSASGLAAVWATENTRQSIFDAFKRKEVYATTGPRIRVRFFGGWRFSSDDTQLRDLAATGYRKGVPMGGELTADGAEGVPTFLVHAVKDPVGGNLDRVQIVKGWLDSAGKTHERVYDVAWSGDRIGPDGLEPVGNTVDVTTGRYDNSIGAAELVTAWRDPDFDRAQYAFYYVRVLQIPTPRHSLLDALALGKANIDGFPATIQERAYSSPIWYTP